MKRLISILGMLVVFSLSYGLDRASAALKDYRAETFLVVPALWAETVIRLIFAIGIMFMAWLVHVKYNKDIPTALIFLLAGLIVVLSSTPLGIHFHSLLPFRLRLWLPIVSFRSLLAQSGAFAMLIGLAGLLRKV